MAIPVYVKQNINFFETGPCGRLDITIGPKQTMGKTVEDLKVTMHMPKSVLSANLTATQGNYTYDLASKVTIWEAAVGTFCHIYIIKSQSLIFLLGSYLNFTRFWFGKLGNSTLRSFLTCEAP